MLLDDPGHIKFNFILNFSPSQGTGEHVWRTDDIISLIEEQGDSIALVWLPGIIEVNKLLKSCDSHCNLNVKTVDKF